MTESMPTGEPQGRGAEPGPPSPSGVTSVHEQARRALSVPGNADATPPHPLPAPPAADPAGATQGEGGPQGGPDAARETGADVPGPAEDAPQPDDGPQPLGLRVEPTGHPPVDAQLERLEDADHLAVSGHLEVYEDVHRGLRDTLTALDRHDPHPHPRS